MNFKKTFYKTGQSFEANKYNQTMSNNKLRNNENVDYVNANKTIDFLRKTYQKTSTNYNPKKPIIS